MQIQWFPGHMHKARVQIKETLPKVDLLIELLDARIPFSSENPMLASLRGDKPCIKVLNKADLADPKLTKTWKNYLEKQSGVRARETTTEKPGTIRRLSELCVEMLPHKQGDLKTITTMIVGIPNVGKSTLINILAGRTIAKTGNEPAITKGQQRINIGNGITLMDTPGVLWPNVENRNSGFRLAATGAIKDTAMDYADVGFICSEYLLANYAKEIAERFEVESVPQDPEEFFDLIGRKRGCMRRGGVVDLDRICRIFLNELRGGKFGPVTLETPEMMEAELAEVEKKRLAKLAKDAKRTDKRKSERSAAGAQKKRRRRRRD